MLDIPGRFRPSCFPSSPLSPQSIYASLFLELFQCRTDYFRHLPPTICVEHLVVITPAGSVCVAAPCLPVDYYDLWYRAPGIEMLSITVLTLQPSVGLCC